MDTIILLYHIGLGSDCLLRYAVYDVTIGVVLGDLYTSLLLRCT
jgi:hypothetical protein